MKKLLVLLLTLAMAVAMLVCPALAEEEKPLEGGFIPVLPLGVAHQFWQAVKTGAEQAAEEYGVTIVFDGPQDETMVDRQVDILRANLTNEDLIAVCMAAIDTQAVEADLSSVKEQGMPVVGFDAGVGAIADAHCSTSNYAAGRAGRGERHPPGGHRGQDCHRRPFPDGRGRRAARGRFCGLHRGQFQSGDRRYPVWRGRPPQVPRTSPSPC